MLNIYKPTTISMIFVSTILSSPFTMADKIKIEEIIVTAQKRDQKLIDVPITIDNYNSTELSKRGISSLEQLTLASPSILFQKGFGPGADNYIMRGVGSLALEGGIQPSVTMVVDGVALSRMSQFSGDVGDIERIEILHGPQGTLYGRNAIGGLVNVVSARPLDNFSSYIEQSLTTDNQKTTRGMITGPLSNNVKARFSGFYTKNDEYIENVVIDGEDIGEEKNYGFSTKIAIDISENLNLMLSADYREEKTKTGGVLFAGMESGSLVSSGRTYDEIGRIKTIALGAGNEALGNKILNDHSIVSDSFSPRMNRENYGYSAELNWDINKSLSLVSISALRSTEYFVLSDIDHTPANPLNTYGVGFVHAKETNLRNEVGLTDKLNGFFSTDTIDSVSQEIRLHGTDDNNDWVVGFYYGENEESGVADLPFFVSGNALLANELLSRGVDNVNYSIFGDITHKIGDEFEIFGGARWTVEKLDSMVDIMGYTVPVALTPPGTFIFGEEFTYINPEGVSSFLNRNNFKASTQAEDWSGRFGVNWDVTDNARIYTSVSRGFVGAGANIGRTASVDNPFLEPTTALAYELGVKAQLFENSLIVNLSTYYQEVNDIQTSRLIPGTVRADLFNAGLLKSKGVDLSASWLVSDRLRIDTQISIIDAKINDLFQPCYPGQTASTGCNLDSSGNLVSNGGVQQDVSGNKMIMSPDLSYNLQVTYDIPISNSLPFYAETSVVYTWQDEVQYQLTYDPLTVEDAYGTLDVSLSINDRDDKWSVILYGKNITDEFYNVRLSAGGGFTSPTRLASYHLREADAFWGLKFRWNF